MAVPARVGSGSGATVLTGTGTASKTGCTAGNVIIIHFRVRGSTEDWSAGNVVNIETLDGVDNDIDGVLTSEGGVWIGRAMTSATCSMDFTVGASSEDIYARVYEFSGVSTSTSIAGVVENGASTFDSNAGTSTTVGAPSLVTNGADRLALAFIALNTNQAASDFTGETGGDWTESDEYQGSTGATCTLQLQTASKAAAGTISGGSYTVTSTFWLVYTLALISPAAVTSTSSGLLLMGVS